MRMSSRIDDQMVELLEMDIIKENGVVFTPEAIKLIHEMAPECEKAGIYQAHKEESEKHWEGETAEDIYMEMVVKIADAPMLIFALSTVRMMIPAVSRALKKRGDAE